MQSRYYDPAVGRFINADSYASTGRGIVGNNMFAYCANNPVTYRDSEGKALETVLDILSLGASIADVIENPDNPWAWIGLAGDLIDVAVPFVAGVGEAAKAISFVANAADTADDVYDAVKIIDAASNVHDASKATDIAQVATKGTPNQIGKIGEQLAGIDPSAKVSIQVNGRTRIPDAMTDTVLTEVKNVKYISNTQQLRDFASYANATGRSLELYVRPTTKVAQTVIDAGWNIKYLW